MNPFSPPDLTRLTRLELLARKHQLDAEITAIKMQLQHARRMTHDQAGAPADRRWRLRALQAMRIKGMESHAVQMELSRRKEHPPERPKSLALRFVEIARQRLDEAVFADILSEAQELAAERE